MIGAIAGDIIGSVYEGNPCRDENFLLFSRRSNFTDDTVLAVATAEVLLGGGDYAECHRRYGRKHPDAGYGGNFKRWIFQADAGPYGSWGNGSAMRVAPVGWAGDDISGVLEEAQRSASVTHDHPEGIRGAQAVAAAVYWARMGVSKEELRSGLGGLFGYDLDRSAREIRKDYHIDVSCQGSVPEALVCFLDAADFEEAVRLAVLLGGDSDTQACVAGAVAEAWFGGVPEPIVAEVKARLPEDFLRVVEAFERRFGGGVPR